MAEEKSLRIRVAEMIGATTYTPEARAIYMLVDKVELLEKEIDTLKRGVHNIGKRTRGLQKIGGE